MNYIRGSTHWLVWYWQSSPIEAWSVPAVINDEVSEFIFLTVEVELRGDVSSNLFRHHELARWRLPHDLS